MEYFLGYVVRKFESKYPFLGSSGSVDPNSWIACMDKGGLRRMGGKYADEFALVENVFLQNNGESLENRTKHT